MFYSQSTGNGMLTLAVGYVRSTDEMSCMVHIGSNMSVICVCVCVHICMCVCMFTSTCACACVGICSIHVCMC